MTERVRTGECECGAVVAGTAGIVTVEGDEIAFCAVDRRAVVVK